MADHKAPPSLLEELWQGACSIGAILLFVVALVVGVQGDHLGGIFYLLAALTIGPKRS